MKINKDLLTLLTFPPSMEYRKRNYEESVSSFVKLQALQKNNNHDFKKVSLKLYAILQSKRQICEELTDVQVINHSHFNKTLKF